MANKTQQDEVATNSAHQNNSLILLVDDSPNNIQFLSPALRKEGYSIASATNRKQALDLTKEILPDLIVLDVITPELDGFETCKALKLNPKTAEIPVIFITSKIDSGDKAKGLKMGAVDFITKPFQPVEILARIQTQLQLKKVVDSLKYNNKQLQKMVQERTRALIRAERYASFSLMAQGIVHNLRNPLTVITGGLQLLQLGKERFDKLANSKPQKEISGFREQIDSVFKYLNLIDSGSTKLMTMIDSLVEKSESDKSEQIEETNLNHIIQKEIEFLRGNLHFKHHVAKQILLSDSALMIEVVPSEIAQVFQNLIQNSLDALLEQPHPQITIETGNTNNSVWFSVSDNGHGIAEENLSKIFDPFFSTKPETGSRDDEKPTGLGLGLHICSEMLKSYQGKITVESESGKGSKFIVSLPGVARLENIEIKV